MLVRQSDEYLVPVDFVHVISKDFMVEGDRPLTMLAWELGR